MGKDSSCLGCSKKFTKNDAAVQCTVCGLWIHKQCADISNEVFDFLDRQKKETGRAYWGCKPCSTYAEGMNHRLKQIEDELKVVKQSTVNNEAAIQRVEKKVDELVEQAKKTEVLTKDDLDARMREEREEMRERKEREMNVIIHGLDECENEEAGGEERIKWDKKQCIELAKSQHLKLEEHDIKFCRRVGPRKDKERPLVVGLYSQITRNKLMKGEYEEGITVGPDMTRRQREEEAEVWNEMAERNKNRTEEQVSKNLSWRIVGQKGERRLVLGPTRTQDEQGARRGTRGGARGGTRGGTSGTVRGGPRGGRTVVRGSGRWSETYRQRIGSKRKERDHQEEEEEEMEEGTSEPPAKH
jgi:hypothetical protein